MNPSTSATSLRIWDLPTRLFHFALIACVAGLIITGEIGGEIMTLHFYLGYAVLTLVFFRLVWGFVGGHWSRFIHFIPSPAELRAYIASLRPLNAKPSAGHNPLGALSVLTMLLVLLAQVFSGFLSDDEVSVSGPWTAWAPGAWVELASEYHTDIGNPWCQATRCCPTNWLAPHLPAQILGSHAPKLCWSWPCVRMPFIVWSI
jgi:cytochrome b